MYLDLLLLIFILSFAVAGFIQGFIYQSISLAILLSVALGAWPMAQWLKYSSEWSWAKPIPSFVLWCFMAMLLYLLGSTLRILLQKKIHRGPLQAADRWAGFAIGGVKAVLIALMIGVVLESLPDEFQNKLSETDPSFRESKIMAASSNIFSWNGIASIRQLRLLKSKFNREDIRQSDSPSHPWNWENRVDPD